MKKHKTLRLNRVAALAAALILAIGCMSVAYAADVGGIQTQVQIWLNGKAVDAQITQVNDSEYHVTWSDSSGSSQEIGVGGVSIDGNGNETPLDADAVAEMLSSGDVSVDENGRVMLYFYDQSVDITDQFDENNECRITLEHNGTSIYFLIRDEGDDCYPFSASTEGYEELENNVYDKGESYTSIIKVLETDE